MNPCKALKLPPPPIGGFYENTVNPPKNCADNLLVNELMLELKGINDHQDESTIQPKSDFYQQIVIDIVNTPSDEQGNFSCKISFKGEPFLVSQSASDPTKVNLVNLANGQKTHISAISFSDFKKHLLLQYIKAQRYLGHFIIDLHLLDLTGINLSDVLLTHTILNRRSVDAIIKCGADLAGATIAPGQDVTGLNLKGVPLDKSMANSLIHAGADFKSVLTSYLATEPGTLSHHYKATMLSQYIEKEHREERLPVDLSGFDLRNVDCKNINFKDTQLSKAQAEIIVRNGGNLTGAVVTKATTSTVTVENTEKKSPPDFARDFLALLKAYSQTVASLIVKSTSRDEEDNAPSRTFEMHTPVIEHVQSYPWTDPQRASTAIKLSTGNCGEMALACKNMLDLYLAESLRQLGYHGVSFTALLYKARAPSDHGIVKLACSYQGITETYLIDPWSGGKAWTLQDGMDYFRIPRMFTRPDVEFEAYPLVNSWTKLPQYQFTIRNSFDQLGVKKQLDFIINKMKFEGSSFAGSDNPSQKKKLNKTIS